MQINRLFEIVYILMNKKNVTAKELSEHFEVSQRTIYRDVETLCQAGIPIYTNKGKGGGICLMEHFVLNKSILSEQEQTDILVALQSFKATSFSDTNQVLSKLNTIFGTNSPDWIEVDFSNWSSNEEDKNKFYQLKTALLQHMVIEFHYYSSYGQETIRTIEPYKLLFKGQAWYLYGFCKDKKEFRYFKISRMKKLTITSEQFAPQSIEISDEQSYKPYDMDSEQLTEVLLKIGATMAYRVYDEFSADAITLLEDGSFSIRSKLAIHSWIYSYFMSYEDQIEIIEPIWLRDNLVERYKNVLSKYNMTY